PRDHVVGDTDDQPDEAGEAGEAGEQGLEQNIKSRSTWLRLLFMILFIVLWGISRLVILAVVILQFFWVLFTGRTNARLGQFGRSLATYSYQIIFYLTYNSEEQPFPFTEWPMGPPAAPDGSDEAAQ
ncbi:MAG TPA: DUF4389 domain-containing protein, partial [Gammaproteobacteria bacterium]|nr:DUF4389 domain-containing protein [Gammaproteobacteria bacterium]